MKSLLLSLILLGISGITSSQTEIINSIKDRYYSISDENINYHEITLNTILPAVGQRTHILRFYYNSSQIDPEEDVYNFNYSLVKVVSKYNVSASIYFTYEYLFNEKNQLIFYFDKEEGSYENYEKRYYFNENKLIRCIIKGVKEDGKQINYKKDTSFSEDDFEKSRKALKKSNKYSDLFKQIISADNID